MIIIFPMQKKEIITIHDIARKAGVSPSTVSRVMNNTVPVADNKREAVLAAVAALNYRPNILAQNLVRGRSMAIGILTQNIASPFYGEIHQGIEQGLKDSGYHPLFVVGNWHLPEELVALETLTMRQVDGIIMLAGTIPDERVRQVAATTPLIMAGRWVKGLEQQCLQVDNIKGSYEATCHLLQLGHRRIVLLQGVLNHGDAVERRLGYEQAMREANLEIDPQLIIDGQFTRQSGLLAVEQLLNRNVFFSAMFAMNDEMAYGARLVLYRRGLRVPEDISIIGFDDTVQSAYTTPPLTTIRYPMFEMGLQAAQAILKLIQGETVILPLLPTQLIVRESTVRYHQ